MHPYNHGSIWAAAMIAAQPHSMAGGELAWVIPAIGLLFAAAGYGLVVVSDFNAMLRSLQPVAAVQRFMGWFFTTVGLALTLVSSWIILFD